MAIQTSFAKKVTWSQDGNHRFLALLGNDGEFDLALLDVKNRVCAAAGNEDIELSMEAEVEREVYPRASSLRLSS